MLDRGLPGSGLYDDIKILSPVSTGDGDLPGVQEPPRAAAAAFAFAAACALGHRPCLGCCPAPHWCVQVGVRSPDSQEREETPQGKAR